MINNVIILILLAFTTGIIVKYTDDIEDLKKKKQRWLKICLGFLYGLLLFLVVYLYPFMAPLWVGTVIGMLVYGRIDALSHYAGIAVFLSLFLIFIGFQLNNLYLLGLFVLVNIGEEYINDMFDKGKIKNKILSKIVSVRPLLEITTFIIAAFTGIWMMWFGLLSFDLGYILIGRLEK
ncbi:hypothetical protein GF361_05970 [Candidatus Woesearchaeota archaeon]|nr:hypothetical protein [Candidatus Woesearchaeota archaeon]